MYSLRFGESRKICIRLRLVLALGITIFVAGGCASDQSRRIDLASVQTVGVVVPPGSSEPAGAEDVMQLYNLTVGEDRLKNAAVGAGTGAVVGTAAGVGAGAIVGCAAFGPLAPWCWGSVMIAGAVLGGGTGAVAGATVDTQEQVDVAPVHLYEVNQVLPDLKRDYLTSPVLQQRALRIARGQDTSVDFVPAGWNGERYASADTATPMGTVTDVNLVLAEMNVSLNGKARDDPNLILTIAMQWNLTSYNAETRNEETRDVMSANYESKKHQLSEWLADDGAVLKAEVDTGIETAMTSAFSDLPRMTGQ